MRQILPITLMSAIGLALGASWSDDGHDEAYRLHQERKILALEEILDRAGIPRDARILEVEHEFEHGRRVYEIEYVAPDGRVIEVEVDARSGEVLEREED